MTKHTLKDDQDKLEIYFFQLNIICDVIISHNVKYLNERKKLIYRDDINSNSKEL